MLDARAGGQLQRVGRLPLLEAEQRDARRARGRRERLAAERGERVLSDLHAERAFERAELAVPRLDARLVAVIAKRRARHAVLDFLMLVIRVAEVEFQLRERPAQIAHLRRERDALLPHLKPRVGFGDGAVVRFVAAVRCADVAVRPRVRAARRAAVTAAVAVRQPAVRLAGVLAVERALARRMRMARNPQRVGLAAERVEMKREAAVAAFDERRARTRIVRAAVARVERARDARDRFARNPVVDRVDDAADRVAAVQQRRRPAHDLDALDAQRILRHRVIVGQRRRVVRGDAVLQEADAIAVHPADDRTADERAIGRRGHAGQAVQRVAERIGAAQRQRVAGQRRGGRAQRRRAERVRGHEDRRERRRGRRVRSALGGRRARLAMREARGEQQRQGMQPASERRRDTSVVIHCGNRYGVVGVDGITGRIAR